MMASVLVVVAGLAEGLRLSAAADAGAVEGDLAHVHPERQSDCVQAGRAAEGEENLQLAPLALNRSSQLKYK